MTLWLKSFRVLPVLDVDESTLLRMAVSLEASSQHPIAQALKDVAEKSRLSLFPVDHFQEVPHRGVGGRVHNRHVLFGSAAYLAECRLEFSEGLADAGSYEHRMGNTLAWMGWDGKVCAYFVFQRSGEKVNR